MLGDREQVKRTLITMDEEKGHGNLNGEDEERENVGIRVELTCDESRRGILKRKWRKGERWEDRRGRGRSCVVVQSREREGKGERRLDCE